MVRKVRISVSARMAGQGIATTVVKLTADILPFTESQHEWPDKALRHRTSSLAMRRAMSCLSTNGRTRHCDSLTACCTPAPRADGRSQHEWPDKALRLLDERPVRTPRHLLHVSARMAGQGIATVLADPSGVLRKWLAFSPAGNGSQRTRIALAG